MALTKRVKTGGAFYKGYELIVSSSPGDYTLDMKIPEQAVVNSISAIPDEYGVGDTFELRHLNSDTTETISVIAETIYNPGANTPMIFDLPAAQPLQSNDTLRLIYTNTATVALNIHTTVEYVGPRRTS